MPLFTATAAKPKLNINSLSSALLFIKSSLSLVIVSPPSLCSCSSSPSSAAFCLVVSWVLAASLSTSNCFASRNLKVFAVIYSEMFICYLKNQLPIILSPLLDLTPKAQFVIIIHHQICHHHHHQGIMIMFDN